jgi:hypothetical protein
MSDPLPLTTTCHCGAVHVHVAKRPDYLNECNCSLCNSHGVWWGYFAPEDVAVTGETKVYTRADRDEPAVELHFCGHCGCTTHWTPTEVFVAKTGAANRMGVNMRLFDRAVLAGVELRFPDGMGWDGIGQWGFVKEAEQL